MHSWGCCSSIEEAERSEIPLSWYAGKVERGEDGPSPSLVHVLCAPQQRADLFTNSLIVLLRHGRPGISSPQERALLSTLVPIHSMMPQRVPQRLLLFLFFLSGFAALLYQVAWQRMLVFYTSSDTVSISLIVTAFMSGLGLGYLYGGHLADRQSPRRNLFTFVLAEVGILVFAMFSKYVLYDLLYHHGPQPQDSPVVLYAMVFGVLLLPTFLMGVSLPLLSKGFQMHDITDQGRFIGRLYFTNTLGAAVGALITGVVLVRTMGYQQVLWVGVSMNAICALATLFLVRTVKDAASGPSGSSATAAPLQWSRSLLTWSAQYALSGFAALSLEMIWFRVLETLIKSVSLTFSILLAIYLGSMAAGSWAGARWGARRSGAQRERLFLRAQYLLYAYVGVSILTLLWAVGSLDALAFLKAYFKSYEPDLTPRIILPTYVLIPLFLMFVPTFIMGVSFSLSQLIIHDDPAFVGRKLGWVQFINIVGSALGAWCVTWIGFEYLGTATLIKLIIGLALVYLLVAWRRGHEGLAGALVAGTVVVGAFVLLPGNASFWRQLSGMDDPQRFFYDENASGLSVIKRNEWHGELAGLVFANGLGQSVIPYRLDAVHTKLGALPVLLHPDPKRVAVIGLGSSGTLHGTAARRETEELVCFEIMSNQARVLQQYAAAVNDGPILRMLADPRLDLVLHDGRYRLTTDTTRYDVIEADALRPSSAFSGNIYSKEYYALLLSRLRPGGYAATWCPTPRVARTAKEVFPYSILIDDLLMIGSNTPIALDLGRTRELLASPHVQEHFARADIDIGQLLSPALDRIGPLSTSSLGGDVNTDLFPRDEFEMPYTWALIKAKILGRPLPGS